MQISCALILTIDPEHTLVSIVINVLEEELNNLSNVLLWIYILIATLSPVVNGDLEKSTPLYFDSLCKIKS